MAETLFVRQQHAHSNLCDFPAAFSHGLSRTFSRKFYLGGCQGRVCVCALTYSPSTKVQVKMSGPQCVSESSVRLALGLGLPVPLAKTSSLSGSARLNLYKNRGVKTRSCGFLMEYFVICQR